MRQHLGQHFLNNQDVIRRIIEAIDPQRGETIIEIGPGHGELTLPLAETCTRVGAHIIAIEKDRFLAGGLRGKICDLRNVELIEGDAKELLKSFPAHSTSTFKIVGNIPYYITGYLMRMIGELPTKPARCVFTVQKEVAERIVAKPPRMNRIAAFVQFWSDPRVVAHINKEQFHPQPKVDSAVIVLEIRSTQYEPQITEHYYKTVRALFQQPRKTIVNNLRAISNDNERANIEQKLSEIGIVPTDRPQDLSRDDILRITEALFTAKT